MKIVFIFFCISIVNLALTPIGSWAAAQSSNVVDCKSNSDRGFGSLEIRESDYVEELQIDTFVMRMIEMDLAHRQSIYDYALPGDMDNIAHEIKLEELIGVDILYMAKCMLDNYEVGHSVWRFDRATPGLSVGGYVIRRGSDVVAYALVRFVVE